MDNKIVTSKIVRQYLQKQDRLAPAKLVFLNIPVIKTVPPIVDLRLKCGPIGNQGNLGSCTAFALSSVVSFIKQKSSQSELFIYYNERVIANTVNQDSGAMMRDGISALQKYGVCNGVLWPYSVKKFKDKPPPRCYLDAAKNKALSVQNIPNTMPAMQNCLANGYPFVVGIPVYPSFESYAVSKTGQVPMPLKTDPILGYHAVVCVGFNNTLKCWIMRNSWGAAWGAKGYFYLPYAYLTTDATDKVEGFDLWVITQMSAVLPPPIVKPPIVKPPIVKPPIVKPPIVKPPNHHKK
jgi:C1A family cysteine protease